MGRAFAAIFIATSLIAVPGPAIGAPPIAYAKVAGTKNDLFLTNPNGTGTVKIYTSGARSAIGAVDMNPVANEVAIIESRATGFKIIHFNDAGVRTNITTFDDGCRVQYLDYHPSDGSLLVNRLCLNPQKIDLVIWSNGAYGEPFATTDGQNDSYGQVRWLGDGSGFLVAYSKVGEGSSIQRRNLSNPSTPLPIWTSPNLAPPNPFDVARCAGALDSTCSKLLYTTQAGTIREVTFSDFGLESDTFKMNGMDGHYSPDNNRILYRATLNGTYTLNVTNPNQLSASKGTYFGKDWRP